MALLRLTVSQLNAYVQRTLQSDALLRDVEVSGEIGNFKLYGSGMLFFSLRDAQATLPCVMFAEDVAGWLTPVPGGVGPMTIAMLLMNTLQAAEGAWRS